MTIACVSLNLMVIACVWNCSPCVFSKSWFSFSSFHPEVFACNLQDWRCVMNTNSFPIVKYFIIRFSFFALVLSLKWEKSNLTFNNTMWSCECSSAFDQRCSSVLTLFEWLRSSAPSDLKDFAYLGFKSDSIWSQVK